MNYQRNTMRYGEMHTPCGQTPSAVNNGQNVAEPQYGRRPMNGGGCCGCEHGGDSRNDNIGAFDCLHGMSLAMVYSPCQEFEDLYDHTEGLRRGTIFRQLDKPFMGKGGRCNG